MPESLSNIDIEKNLKGAEKRIINGVDKRRFNILPNNWLQIVQGFENYKEKYGSKKLDEFLKEYSPKIDPLIMEFLNMWNENDSSIKATQENIVAWITRLKIEKTMAEKTPEKN